MPATRHPNAQAILATGPFLPPSHNATLRLPMLIGSCGPHRSTRPAQGTGAASCRGTARRLTADYGFQRQSQASAAAMYCAISTAPHRKQAHQSSRQKKHRVPSKLQKSPVTKGMATGFPAAAFASHASGSASALLSDPCRVTSPDHEKSRAFRRGFDQKRGRNARSVVQGAVTSQRCPCPDRLSQVFAAADFDRPTKVAS